MIRNVSDTAEKYGLLASSSFSSARSVRNRVASAEGTKAAAFADLGPSPKYWAKATDAFFGSVDNLFQSAVVGFRSPSIEGSGVPAKGYAEYVMRQELPALCRCQTPR